MRQDGKKILKILSLSVLFIFIIIYAFFNAKSLILGVEIKDVVISPSESEPNILRVTGNAKNAKILKLNGREISIDQAGNFNETIAILVGYNIITITAEDKFGYMDEENYQLTGK